MPYCRAEDLEYSLLRREYANPKRVALAFFHFWKSISQLYLRSSRSLETTLGSRDV
jgi:hypothetical protein